MNSQRDRFEAAMLEAGYVRSNYAGDPAQWNTYTRIRWEGFQLGEASGLELAFPLYQAINDLVALFGKHGVVDRRHAEVDALMDALYRIDGGARINTVEQIRALLAREAKR